MRNNDLRERRKQLADLLADARGRLADAKAQVDDCKGKLADADFSDPAVMESSAFKEAQKAAETKGTIEDEINRHQRALELVLGYLGESSENEGPENNPALVQTARGWDGHRLLAESQSYDRAKSMGLFHSTDHFGTINFGEIASRDEAPRFLYSLGAGGIRADAYPAAPAGPVGTSVGVVPDFRGLVPPNLMSLSLLDLLPTGTTDSNTIEYVQLTATPQAAAETAELATKPQGGITYVDATAPVRTIAAFVKAARQALADTPFLASLLNTLLPYDVRRRLLSQVLSGDGAGQNLRGIYNTTGVGSVAYVTNANAAEMVLRAMTQIILSDGDPNFVAINPLVWQSLLLLREGSTIQNTTTNPAAFQGEYLYGAPGMLPQGMTQPTIWGLRMTTSRVVPQNTPLVGDSASAMLIYREGVNTRTSDSDQDDFVKNRVTILAETRVALPVWRPVGFCIANLA